MERRRRRWWTITITVISSLIVLAALASGAFQVAVRSVPGYREQLAHRLEALLGRPVTIGDLRLSWRGYYPSLDVDRITLLATDTAPDAVAADRLRLAFSLPRLVARDFMPTRVDLIGAELSVSRDAEGHLHVRGFQSSANAQPGALLDRLREISALRLQRCVLVFTDERMQIADYRFDIVRGELDQSRSHFEADLDLGLPAKLGQSLSVHADLDGDIAKPETWSGPWAAYLRGLADGPLLRPSLAPDVSLAIEGARLRMKGEIQGGHVPQMSAEWESGAINAQRGDFHYHVNATSAVAQIAMQAGSWSAQIDHLDVDGAAGAWPQTHGELHLLRSAGATDFGISIDFLRVSDLAPWLSLLASTHEIADLREAGGDLAGLQWHWHREEGKDDRYSLAASLRNVHLAAGTRSVGFANLTGELSANEQGGRINLQHVPLWFELPKAFPAPGQFDTLTAQVSWQRSGEDWQVRAPDFQWKLAGSDGRGSLSVLVPKDGSPLLDLNARFSVADAVRFKGFMPFKWGPGLHDWLDRAIESARVPQAELTIKGPLADFPFHKTNNGTFLLDVDVADAKVAFQPDWPPLERLGAHLKFHGNSLDIAGEGAAILGARVGEVKARFADFHDALLVIDGDIGGDLSKLYRLIEASPLQKTLAALVHHTRATGPAQVDVHLSIPLHDAKNTVSSGTIHLKDASLEYQALKEPIRGITGEVRFGPDGVSGDSLIGQFYEVPIHATLKAVTPHLSRLQALFRYAPRVDGTGVSTLVPDWILPNLTGESAWVAELDVGSEANSSLRLSTDLQGVTVKFPSPLAKRSEETIPLQIGFSGDDAIPLRIGVNYQDRFAADLQFAGAKGNLALNSGLLRLGPGPAVATEPGVVLIGHTDQFDLGEWSAAMTSSSKNERPTQLKRAELTIEHPIVAGENLLPITLKYAPVADGWQAELHGDGAEGLLSWHDAGGGTVKAQLQHVALIMHNNDEPQAKAPDKPPVDPGKMPLLDLDCINLNVGGVALGHLRLTTEHVPGGLRLSQLKIDTGALDLQGSGQWWRRDNASGANLSLHLASERTSDVLRALDYAPSVTARAAKFDADLLWAANPRGIELAQARGHLAIQLENGNLKAIEPGAGRVLGLLNFYALPRRLTLNFRDVVGQGLAFDKIRGTFDVGDGNAVTDDLTIDGPSLKMETRGRVGLVARDYDQRISVYPDVSSGVTLGALLIGGPALGALALIAQQVLDKPLEQATQLTYHLGGTWDNPEIKRGDGSPIDESKIKRRAEAGKP